MVHTQTTDIAETIVETALNIQPKLAMLDLQSRPERETGIHFNTNFCYVRESHVPSDSGCLLGAKTVIAAKRQLRNLKRRAYRLMMLKRGRRQFCQGCRIYASLVKHEEALGYLKLITEERIFHIWEGFQFS